jgi:hypothetical protein
VCINEIKSVALNPVGYRSSLCAQPHFIMSLYYEAAEVLTASNNAGGSLKSRIFSKKDSKSQPAQIYALAIETCKWSSVLKEVIENADILRLERKVRPDPFISGVLSHLTTSSFHQFCLYCLSTTSC